MLSCMGLFSVCGDYFFFLRGIKKHTFRQIATDSSNRPDLSPSLERARKDPSGTKQAIVMAFLKDFIPNNTQTDYNHVPYLPCFSKMAEVLEFFIHQWQASFPDVEKCLPSEDWFAKIFTKSLPNVK